MSFGSDPCSRHPKALKTRSKPEIIAFGRRRVNKRKIDNSLQQSTFARSIRLKSFPAKEHVTYLLSWVKQPQQAEDAAETKLSYVSQSYCSDSEEYLDLQNPACPVQDCPDGLSKNHEGRNEKTGYDKDLHDTRIHASVLI